MTEYLKRGVPGMSSIKDLPITQDAPVSASIPNHSTTQQIPPGAMNVH